jgi:hypothetical protein
VVFYCFVKGVGEVNKEKNIPLFKKLLPKKSPVPPHRRAGG